MHRIDTFLELVVQQKGSDLHLISGQPPRIRVHGALYEVKYRQLTSEETSGLLLDIMPDHVRQEWESPSCYGVDFAYEIPGMARFRINVLCHLNGVGAVIRPPPRRRKYGRANDIAGAHPGFGGDRHVRPPR